MDVLWLTQIPLLLMATASLLIDLSLRKDLLRDRLSCQVWLWLAAVLSFPSSLQPQARGHVLLLQVWVHTVVFCNILSAIVASSTTLLIDRSAFWERSSRILAPSAWVSMIVGTTLEHSNSDIKQSSIVFGMSIIVFYSSQWYIDQKRQAQRDVQGIPRSVSRGCMTSTRSRISSHVFSKYTIKESEWYLWTCSQVLQWISVTLNEKHHDDDTILLVV